MRYTTYGDVRGQGPIRKTEAAAEADLIKDQKGCKSQGGYSDRSLCYIGDDGFLYRDSACTEVVWPSSGRSNGAVRAS